MLKNKTHKELLTLSRKLVQPLIPTFHKGQSGRIAVIGGCEDYTGAPFFSSHLAALIGCDLSHVICEKLAAPIIKLYSPDLMIHPYLYELNNPEIEKYLEKEEINKLNKISIKDLINGKQIKLDLLIDEIILPKILGLIERIDIIVIGPGFGRDPLMLKTLLKLIEQIKVLNKPIILDADSLYLLSIKPSIINNYNKAILTPNVMEFKRLTDALNINHELNESNLEKLMLTTIELSKKLGGVTIIRKGKQELIVKNDEVLINEMIGSPRRVGGQGDTLTGSIATLVNWSFHYQDDLWDHSNDSNDSKLSNDELLVLSCFAACSIVRMASYKAFKKYGRSMQTSNVHQFLGESYNDIYESDIFLKL